MTLLVCHPYDAAYVTRFYQRGERLLTSERCPPQHVLYLADRVVLLVQSGAWFDQAPEAERGLSSSIISPK